MYLKINAKPRAKTKRANKVYRKRITKLTLENNLKILQIQT